MVSMALVEAVEGKLRLQGKADLADVIQTARTSTPKKLTKIVTVVDRTPAGNSGGLSGGINILKVE